MEIELINLWTTLLAAVAGVGFSAAAYAAPIPVGSSLTINGNVMPMGSTTIDAATGLTFSGPLTSVVGTSGVFTGINCSGSCGTINNIPNLSLTSFTAVTPLFVTSAVAGSVSFDLTSLIDLTRTAMIPNRVQASLSFDGLGTLDAPGYDPTPGLFSFRASGDQLTVAFQSSQTATALAVPEPVSLALLGTSLAGLGVLRRRSKR